MTLTTPPLALYVHFPWCVRKCPYCDFNSYALRGELAEEQYVDALLRDLECQAPQLAGRALISVFLGGGTPSLFSPAAIARVLAGARGYVACDTELEITLEANPGTIERGRFAEYRDAGVTRVSLGAQSFESARLEALGRIHSPEDTCRAAAELHAAGLDNFNLDLMYGLPGQEVRNALADIERAIALAPAHISHYELTLESGTLFGAMPPSDLPADETVAEMLGACQARLAKAGFAQYEVSAYARAGRVARHNVNYWTFGDYVGIGAGAHGKLTIASEGRIVRTAQPREPRRYLTAMTAAAQALAPPSQPITPHELPFEFMLNALRLTSGFEPHLFETRTGLSWSAVATRINELSRRGLVSCEAGLWRTTPLGAKFLNDLLVCFLPDAPRGAPATTPKPLSTLA